MTRSTPPIEEAPTATLRKDRSGLRFAMLQVRNPGDPARADEHRAFADRLGVRQDQLLPIDALTETLSPASLADTHALLVGGSGQYSVLDDDPRIHRFVSFLAEISTSGFPVFASCFGFQAIVLGLGGEVVADEDNAEVGSYDLELTDEGAADPLFSALPREFIAQLGHKDQARRYPSGMLNLASSPRTPRQAFRLVGFPVYGTQFHPELTWQENRARFQRYMKEYGKLFGAEAAQRQLDSHRPSPESNTLLGSFVDLFVKPDLAPSAAAGDEPIVAPFNDGRGPLISRES